MNHQAALRFGGYIKRLRIERNLGVRELAGKAGIDSGAMVRLEQGKVGAPQPTTLKALAMVLRVPLADMFVMAGYVIPHDLPSIAPYLHAKYGNLPDETLAAANDYLQRLIDEHDADSTGSLDFEGEANEVLQ